MLVRMLAGMLTPCQLTKGMPQADSSGENPAQSSAMERG